MAVIIPKKPSATLVTVDHVVTNERHLNVDADLGDVVITVPLATCCTNRTVAKVDDSANTVTVNEDGGASNPLAVITDQGVRKGFFVEDGSTYTVR